MSLLKHKLDQHHEITKYKANLVVDGSHAQIGVDVFDERQIIVIVIGIFIHDFLVTGKNVAELNAARDGMNESDRSKTIGILLRR